MVIILNSLINPKSFYILFILLEGLIYVIHIGYNSLSHNQNIFIKTNAKVNISLLIIYIVTWRN